MGTYGTDYGRLGSMVSQSITRTDIAEIHEAIAKKAAQQPKDCNDSHRHSLRARWIRETEAGLKGGSGTVPFTHSKPWAFSA